MMIEKKIAHVWHLYQPPWQFPHILEQITDECYAWMSEFLAVQKPTDFKVTLNLASSLTEQLQQTTKGKKVLENFGIAAQNGVVEFTATPAYHPLLPILPDKHRNSVIKEQIAKNDAINEAVFDKLWVTRGFFLPELAFSPDVAQYLYDDGYIWTLTEDVVYDSAYQGRTVPFDHVTTVNGLDVFFRSGGWSRLFAMHQQHTPSFVKALDAGIESWFTHARVLSGYVILAYDGETLGHHMKGYNKQAMEEYVAALQDRFTPSHIAEFVFDYPHREPLVPTSHAPLRGSWSTTLDDIAQGNYYPLWSDPRNPRHAEYLAEVSQLLDTLPVAPHLVQEQVQRALNSCPLWHAARDPGNGLYEQGLRTLRYLRRMVEENKQEKQPSAFGSLHASLA